MKKKGLSYEEPYNFKEEEEADENYNSIKSGKDSVETDSVEMKQIRNDRNGPPAKAFQNSPKTPYHK